MPQEPATGGARDVVVRRVDTADVDLYRDLRLRALADAPAAFGTTLAEAEARPLAWWKQRVAGAAAATEDVIFVAEEAAVPCGLVAGHIQSNSVELTSMWVDPASRGHGLGKCLIDAVAGWATARRADRLTLWVTEGNTHAIALYEANGFSFTGVAEPHPSQPDLRELAMSRDVSITQPRS